MKMSRFEKTLVNRPQKARKNIERIEERLRVLPLDQIRTVLEIGCGTGMVSAYLAQTYNMRVMGTDYDPEEIKLALQMNKEVPELLFQREDATQLSFADGSFDLVISQNVFHHIPDWENAVSEINRVLKPSGYLIWLDLVFPAWLKRISAPVSRNFGVYTRAEVEQAFSSRGFHSIYQQGISHGLFQHSEQVYAKRM